jgi:phosphate-selective porin OprO and OprP
MSNAPPDWASRQPAPAAASRRGWSCWQPSGSQRQGGSRNRFAGAYLEGGYFLTGEPFRYRDGKFLRPALAQGKGAWELAYRWSWVDLDDGEVQGGEQRNLGLALNYYPAPQARGQLNLIQVNSERPGGDGLLFQARLQLNW